MTTVTDSAAKTRFGELLDRVAQGEEIVITRHEKPVARMVPEGRPSREQVGDAVDALFRLKERIAAQPHGRKPLTAAEIKSAIEEGRR
jgi:prevent-host-death family protein